jgi:DNA replication and repair protein RecF
MAPNTFPPFTLPRIQRLLLNQLRNIRSASLVPGPNINVIYGDNAAGKTTVLEALYLLSTARSFRTRKSKVLINHESSSFSVFAEFIADDSKLKRSIGIERKLSKEQTVKLDREIVRSSSELAESLAVIAIEPTSFEFIEGAPSERRALIDWLLFHVKHDFFATLKDYQNCLKQRNILLRRDRISRSDLQHWDVMLCQKACYLDEQRYALVKEISLSFSQESTKGSLGYTPQIRYTNGWGIDQEAMSSDQASSDPFTQRMEKLELNFERDSQQGYSSIGSHRFDLQIKVDDRQASELLSRGQKKQFVVALYLEVARIYGQNKKQYPIFLLDDLPSELDEHKLALLLEELISLDTQIFITCIDKKQISSLQPISDKLDQVSWFHVKHGEVLGDTH